MNLLNLKSIYSNDYYYEYSKELPGYILRYYKFFIPFIFIVFSSFLIADIFIWRIPAFAFLRIPTVISNLILLFITFSKLKTNRRLVILINTLLSISLLLMGFGMLIIGPMYNYRGISACVMLIVASHFFIKGYKSILLVYSLGFIMAISTLLVLYPTLDMYQFAELLGLFAIFIGVFVLSIYNENTRFNEFFYRENLRLEKKNTQRLYIETQTQNALLYKTNKQLDITLKKLEQLNKSKNKFFSVIAHDLRSPFSSIVSLIEELNINFEDYDLKGIKSRTLLIEDSTKSTLTFLNNLLYWASSQLNGIKINKQLHQLNNLVNNSISPYMNAAILKNIDVNVDINPGINVIVDEKTISVVIVNLFNNAIKYTSKGGKIHISCEVISTKVILSIKDNGMGMDSELMNKLFNIDHNISRRGTENEKGTGLGLVLSFEFMKYNDGKITVESKENEGSCFSISMPLLLEPSVN